MNFEFLRALADLGKEKGIPKELLLETIEAALLSAYKKNFGSDQNVTVSIDHSSGNVQVLAKKEVVEEVTNTATQITHEEAKSIDPECNLGDFVELEVTPANFGRIAAQTAKQVVVQRIREVEREMIYDEFRGREGDIITGVVQRPNNQNIMIDLGKTEAILLPSEQVTNDNYSSGNRIKVYILEVKQTTKGPRIFVSRTHPGLLKRLFELEVPEIHEGIVEVKAISREAGYRSKIAVYSRDENVDPVGACVGQKGIRVQAVVDEINGEKIDIVEWNEDPKIFVSHALSPAKVVEVQIDDDSKVAKVVVPDYQLSLAIGREGQNARLAAKLTGWRIDIKGESQLEETVTKATPEGEIKINIDEEEEVSQENEQEEEDTSS